MEWWQAIILAVVEGVTEFLPVSSTGHLILTSGGLGLTQTEFLKSFEIVIQLGAISAIAVLYQERLRKNPAELKRVAAAFGPTAMVGLAGYKLIKTFLLGNSWVTVISLAIGGAALLLWDDKFNQAAGEKKIADLTYREAAILGLVQAIAVIPGVSRALVTIWGGLKMGLTRKEAVEMSFILAVPTMAAAAGYDLLRSGWTFTLQEWELMALGFGAAAAVTWGTVKWFLNLTKRRGMKMFGWYRLALAGMFIYLWRL